VWFHRLYIAYMYFRKVCSPPTRLAKVSSMWGGNELKFILLPSIVVSSVSIY
jgi:hypothetical protein